MAAKPSRDRSLRLRCSQEGVDALGVVALDADRARHGAADVAGAGAGEDSGAVVARLAAEVAGSACVVVGPVDRRGHSAAKAGVDRLPAGDAAADDRWRIAAQLAGVVWVKRRGRGDDVATEAQRRGAVERA